MHHARTLKIDFSFFIGIVCTLVLIGFIFIYSSSSIYAVQRYGYAHYYLKNQLIGITLGILAFLIARFFPSKLLMKFTPLFFFGSLFLTALSLVPFFSLKIHGSSRWINLGSFAFQPSELLKISCVMYLAFFLTKRSRASFSLKNMYLPFTIIMGSIALLLLKQPDFGLTVTLITTAISLLFIAGIPFAHLMITATTLLPALAALIITQPYRIKRILTFLDPWKDSQGAGFQIIQSLIAVGSGGWFGVGISHSKQKFFYLPMQHTDFIFSIIAEETGLVGCFFLLILFCLLTYFGFKIAWQMKNNFAFLTTLGFTLLINLQACINICVAIGLLPTKGIGLPFISYGNSSLICFLCMIGIIANFVDHEL